MKEFEALRGLRIGCVRYLNSRPLIEPYDGPVVLDHPSALAAALERGEMDVALVPVFEALRLPGYFAVDGVSISSLGPVWSVILAYQGALSEIKQVALDPASRTSVHLCKVFFAEWGACLPEYLPEPAPPGAARSAAAAAATSLGAASCSMTVKASKSLRFSMRSTAAAAAASTVAHTSAPAPRTQGLPSAGSCELQPCQEKVVSAPPLVCRSGR